MAHEAQQSVHISATGRDRGFGRGGESVIPLWPFLD